MFEIGSALREARVRRKVTLQQAEDDTKIRVKYIQAMENEDFDVMPSPAYVKGFLRTYSGYLGLDADVILDEYCARFEPNEEHDAFGGSSALRPRQFRRRNTLAFVAGVCLLVLVLIWIIGYNSPHSTPTPVAPSPSASASATHSPSPKPSPSPSPSAHAVTLSVKADRGATAVDVRRGSLSGEVLFRAVLAQGRTRAFRADGPLVVTVAQPSLVLFTVNGDRVKRRAETVGTSFRVTVAGLNVYQGAP